MPAVKNRPTLTKVDGVWHVKTAYRLIPHSNWDEAAITARVEADKPPIQTLTPAQPDPIPSPLNAAQETYPHLVSYVDHNTAVSLLADKYDFDVNELSQALGMGSTIVTEDADMSLNQPQSNNTSSTRERGGSKAERIRQEYPHMLSILGEQNALETLAKVYDVTVEYARKCIKGRRKLAESEREHIVTTQ